MFFAQSLPLALQRLRAANEADRQAAERAELRARTQRTLERIAGALERRADRPAGSRRPCHYCELGLYPEIPPGGCPACGHTSVNGRPFFLDERGLPQRPVIEHSHHEGRILSVR